jgi:hypothetical protein
MECGKHSKHCNIDKPCIYCRKLPKHPFIGSMDSDCKICGYSIYMPCHNVRDNAN